MRYMRVYTVYTIYTIVEALGCPASSALSRMTACSVDQRPNRSYHLRSCRTGTAPILSES
jgi:hypothetical protein